MGEHSVSEKTLLNRRGSAAAKVLSNFFCAGFGCRSAVRSAAEQQCFLDESVPEHAAEQTFDQQPHC